MSLWVWGMELESSCWTGNLSRGIQEQVIIWTAYWQVGCPNQRNLSSGNKTPSLGYWVWDLYEFLIGDKKNCHELNRITSSKWTVALNRGLVTRENFWLYKASLAKHVNVRSNILRCLRPICCLRLMYWRVSSVILNTCDGSKKIWKLQVSHGMSTAKKSITLNLTTMTHKKIKL